MEKLSDYIRWVGDLDFRAYPFRDADAVILCNIVYYDLKPVFSDGKPEHTVSDCLPMIEAGEAKLMITGGDLGNGEIFELAARSARFGSLRISDYEDLRRGDPPLQFSAVTFHAADFSFIAYRGTDSSIAGWRENCMISFTITEAQRLSLAYAERVIDGGTWYIGGHSKGANLAQYAACLLGDDKWERVAHVYLLDGPGFCPEVMDPRLDRRIDPKTTRLIPEYDVIGMLFEPQITDTKIVRSDRGGILQHSIATWMVEYGAFATAEQNDPGSMRINRLVNDWIESVPQQDRPILVSDLFNALSENGAESVEDLDVDRLESVLISLAGVSPTTQKTLAKIPGKLLFDDAIPAIPQSKTERFRRIISDLRVQGGGLLLAAATLLLMSGILFELTVITIISAFAILQTALLIRRLIKQKGKLDKLQGRVIILAVVIALAASLYFKEHAMFLIGSLLYAVLCIALSYYAIDWGVRQKEPSFLRVLSIVEGVLAGLFGLGFLLIPQAAARPFTISLAACVAVDGLIRLGYRFAQYLARRRQKKA